MGVAAHSIRAVTPEEIRSLHEEALTRGLPFHIHVEEVVKEVEDALAAYGSRPLALLNGLLSSQRNVTAIHCTQADPSDLATFVGAGGTVCLCPLTEGNLGDGILDLSATSALDRAMAFGTDSNARIAFPEELRWAEYVQRLRQQRRGVFPGEAEGTAAGDVAASLFAAGTRNGARSLGVAAGEIAVGQWADLLLLDLDAPALAGATPETLLPAFVFGAGTSAVAGTVVGGAWDLSPLSLRERGRG
jgi:formimidoylglutamate deiminase